MCIVSASSRIKECHSGMLNGLAVNLRVSFYCMDEEVVEVCIGVFFMFFFGLMV